MKIKQIISSLETRWFMSVMATGAIGILWTRMASFLGFLWMKEIGVWILILAFLFFFSASIGYVWRIFSFPEDLKQDFFHPSTSKFFAGISISMAVLSTGISLILVPEKIIGLTFGMYGAGILYGLSIILGLFFLTKICSQTIKSEITEIKHAIGVCLLPPVGVFVSIFAGNFFANSFFAGTNFALVLGMIHFFLLGLLIFLTLFVLMFIIFRLKFMPLPRKEMAPSFFIPLAPVGVSIVAFVSLLPLLSEMLPYKSVLIQFLYLFVPAFLAFGFFWFVIAVMIFWQYIRTEGIPYTLGFWALVFPPAALGVGTFVASQFLPGMGFLAWVGVLWGIISTIIWIFVLIRTFHSIFTGKAFIRPECLRSNSAKDE